MVVCVVKVGPEPRFDGLKRRGASSAVIPCLRQSVLSRRNMATFRGPWVGQEAVKGRSRVHRALPQETAHSDPRSMALIPLLRRIRRCDPVQATLGKREDPAWDGVTQAV